jgi:hypothetical protein
VSYNSTLTSKRVMKKSWYWNWIIFAPEDDMQHIRMADFGL